jgi:hypothetical protein
LRYPHTNVLLMLTLAAIVATSAAVGCDAGLSGTKPAARRGPFTAQDWYLIQADPDAYRGSRMSFTGKVLAAFEASQTPPGIQVFVNPKDGAGVVMVSLSRDPGVRPGQLVVVKGTILGRHSGVGPFSGTDVTVVLMQGSSVKPMAAPSRAPK